MAAAAAPALGPHAQQPGQPLQQPAQPSIAQQLAAIAAKGQAQTVTASAAAQQPAPAQVNAAAPGRTVATDAEVQRQLDAAKAGRKRLLPFPSEPPIVHRIWCAGFSVQHSSMPKYIEPFRSKHVHFRSDGT